MVFDLFHPDCVKRRIGSALFLLCLCAVDPAVAGTIRIASWNLLNWPSAGTSGATVDSATRCPYFRSVVQTIRPSIIVTEENQSTLSTPWFLSQVMNASGNYYRQGVYIQGRDSNNGIFYLDSLFTFVSNRPIETALRDISEFTMVYKPTGDTFRIYAVHLKASTGSANEAQRSAEVDSLRRVTDALPVGSEFIICGDFNIYGDYEAAYQKLIRDDPWNDGNFLDPFQMTGIWNNAAYRFYHTQSTRTTQFGGGSFGGLDDRFDMILFSNGVTQAGGMYYLPGTCQAFGNDGNHYQLAINSGSNASVSQTVADALHFASDHLPVMADFEFNGNSTVDELPVLGDLRIFPNPTDGHVTVSFIAERAGELSWKLIGQAGEEIGQAGWLWFGQGSNSHELIFKSVLPAGRYNISFDFDNKLISKVLYITN
ncbi:MAG: hypothetical protein ACKOA1_06120 [Bacteroidota bacterium]